MLYFFYLSLCLASKNWLKRETFKQIVAKKAFDFQNVGWLNQFGFIGNLVAVLLKFRNPKKKTAHNFV